MMMPRQSWRHWLRQNFFADGISTLISLVLGTLAAVALVNVLDWALFSAVFRPEVELCRSLDHGGACWGVIAEKYRIILFGRYPFDEQWRPLAATLLLLSLIVISGHPASWRRGLLPVWLFSLALMLALMKGGFGGLTRVDTDLWGGLPLTLLLTVVGIGGAFPLAVLIAVGRSSSLGVLRSVLTWYVELVRGMPLIPILFLASFLFPLFLPKDLSVDVLVRVLAAIILFAAAYLSESIRGGLESIPATQREAALALGLTSWQAMLLVLLPQALRAVVPSIVNSAISLFKETSLVTVVSMFDLTGALSLALAGDALWRPFHLEGYLFIGAIYWIGCFSMSRYSLWIEARLRTPA